VPFFKPLRDNYTKASISTTVNIFQGNEARTPLDKDLRSIPVMRSNKRSSIRSRKMEAFQEAVRAAVPPPYISLSKADFSVKFLYLPPREEVPVICEIPLVIEFYSR
jgi:ribosomal protein S4